FVFPGAMNMSHVADADINACYRIRLQIVSLHQLCQCIERSMDACNAGMWLVADFFRFPNNAQSIGQSPRIGLARVGAQVASIRSLQHLRDAGKVLVSQQRRIDPTLSRTSRMESLD